jgi:hypothetical protein
LAIRTRIGTLDRFRVSGTLTLVSGVTHTLAEPAGQRELDFAPRAMRFAAGNGIATVARACLFRSGGTTMPARNDDE